MRIFKYGSAIASALLMIALLQLSGIANAQEPVGRSSVLSPQWGQEPQYPGQIEHWRIRNLVVLMYNAFLFRQPDPSGMQTYGNLIARMGVQGLMESARAIGDSQEFYQNIRARHRPQIIVTNVYRVMFYRDPDPSGMHTYTQAIWQGRSGEAFAAIVGSEEFARNHLY
jgi:hypothetical protein